MIAYVNDVESSVVTPLKTLQGFKRITLNPNQQEEVKMKLNYDSFKLIGTDGKWAVEDGEFEIMIASSSEDIRLSRTIWIAAQ